MQRLDFFTKGSNICFLLKLIIGMVLGLIVGAAGSLPATVSAQTEGDSFPGRLIVEGTWETIDAGHALLKLENNLILERGPAAGQARLWAYDPAVAGNDDPLRGVSLAAQAVNTPGPERALLYVGEGRLLNWDPVTGRYQVQQIAPAVSEQANLLSTSPTVEGTFQDIRAGHELIYLGSGKVLAWEPASGRFRVWRYDPEATGTVDSFPGDLIVEGVWPTIRAGHKLVYLGYNRLLDWEPASGRYRIWRYETVVKGQANPLGATPVVEGVWDTIRAGHELVSLDNNRFLAWEPATGHFRVWEYALTAIGAFTLEDIASRLAGQTVTGVTIITHGFQPFNDTGDSLNALATAIHEKGGGWLLDYDVADDGANGFFDTCTNDCGPPAVAGQGELVLQFDWAPESNEMSDGWGEAAGEALFTILVGLGLIDPAAAGDNIPLHFIGHSFGTAVTSEAIERLARFDVPVDQVTYLDPHDFDQDRVPVDEKQRLFDLGRPAGYGAAVWDNVIFAEVYYQTRGASGISFPGIDVPNGRPIPGAYNKFLSEGQELPDSGDYPLTDTSGDHSYVWTCFYLATVTGSQAMDCPQPATAVDFAATGYAFSRIAAGQPRPDPVFYGTDQDHKYSNPQLVDPATGEPNQTGLADLGLTPAQVTQGRWAPEWNPLTIMNGDFEHRNVSLSPCGATNTCPQPGWSHHGGGGSGHFDADAENTYLVLDGGVPSNDNHTHNWFYTPPEADRLQFDLWRYLVTSEDKLEVLLANEVLQSYAIKADDAGYIPRQVTIPENLRGRVVTLTFRIEQVGLFIGSEVWIDNVTLLEPGSESGVSIYLPLIFK